MATFHVVALLVSLAALFSYLNYHYLHLHPSIGVMLIALLASLGLIAGGTLGGSTFGSELRTAASAFLGRIRFDEALITWMLAFLLFAGGLTVNLREVSNQRGLATLLATVSTVLSMLLVGGLFYPLLRWIGTPLKLNDCLLLGALISPTDPVAVLAVVRTAGASKSTETIIAAESLFNDGVGVVLFLTLLHQGGHGNAAAVAGAAHVSPHAPWLGAIRLFAQEAFGGALLGLFTGALGNLLLRRSRVHQLEVLLTLALAMGTYSLADLVGVSGAIAVVVAALVVGAQGRRVAISRETDEELVEFWELLEELLNAVLFVLIGLELLVMPFTRGLLLAAACGIPVVLAARWISAAAVVVPLSTRMTVGPGLLRILTWGGLRGGLSIAMALIVPPGPGRDPILSITYGVVAFSILVQGTTLRPLVARWTREAA